MELQDEIRDALANYFHEIDECAKAKCYWALLHLVVVLPDICAALETDTGRARPALYRRWCENYLKDPALSGAERYEIRCKVLHQGRTSAGQGRYAAFRFNHPDTGTQHKNLRQEGSETHMDLDITKMAEEIKSATEEWIIDLQKTPTRALNVRRHLPTVARMNEPPGSRAAGYTSPVVTDPTAVRVIR